MITNASSHQNLTSETFRDKSRSKTVTVAKEQRIAVAFRDDILNSSSGCEVMLKHVDLLCKEDRGLEFIK